MLNGCGIWSKNTGVLKTVEVPQYRPEYFEGCRPAAHDLVLEYLHALDQYEIQVRKFND